MSCIYLLIHYVCAVLFVILFPIKECNLVKAIHHYLVFHIMYTFKLWGFYL